MNSHYGTITNARERLHASTLVPVLFTGYSLVVSVPQVLVGIGGGLFFRRHGIALLRHPSGASSVSVPDTAPNLALQRTRPAAEISGTIKPSLGGPVR